MKKILASRFKKARKGESSTQGSHPSHEATPERREEEASHTYMVSYAPPLQVREPTSGLMLSYEELQKFNILRASVFAHISIIDPVLMDRTSMTTEFSTIFGVIGWGGFHIVHEHGIELLTKEFLCTLKITTNGVAFCLFGEEYDLTWSLLNTALGFEHDCELDLDRALHRFNKEEF